MTEIIPHLNHKQDLSRERSDHGPGQILADARKRAGKSAEDLARALNVAPKIIDRLERDDYASLPPVTFVRGYLRTFAREVGVDPAEILERHTRMTGNDGTSADEPLRRLGTETQTMALGWLFPAIFWGIIILVVIGVISLVGSLWGDEIIDGAKTLFEGESNSLTAPDGTTSQLVRDGEIVLSLSSSAPAGTSATEEPQPTTDLRASTVPTSDEVDTSAISAPSAPSASANQAGESVIATTAALTTTAATVATTAPDKARRGTALSSQEPSTLVLRFSDRSWIRIIDSQGKRLLAGEVAKSERRTVTGMAPFSVRIGNAGAVAIEHDGRPVAYSPQVSGTVAEFIIDTN